MRYRSTSILLVGLAVPTTLAAQSIETGPVDLRLSGRVQVQYNTTSIDEDDVASDFDDEIPFSVFETRRVRFSLEAEIDDWITGKLEPDFALGKLSLKDAWINLGFDPRFELRIGQFKKPFSLIELTSSTKIPTIERGVRIRGLAEAFEPVRRADGGQLLTDFDGDPVFGEEYEMLDALGYVGHNIGIAVHGSFGRIGYELGVFNGNGPDARDDNSEKSAAARVTVRPLTDRPLTLGVNTSYRELRFDGTIDGVEFEGAELDGAVFGVDAEWGEFRRSGLHVLAEVVGGNNLLTDQTLLGAQAIAAWFFARDGERVEGLEPLLRVSYGDADLDRDLDRGVLVTPGFNLYFFGRNRLQFNWDIFFSEAERVDTAHSLRAQAQVFF